MPYCVNCGSEIKNDDVFCKACGSKTGIEQPVQTIAESVPPVNNIPPSPAVVDFTPQNAASSNKGKLWQVLFVITLVLLVSVGAVLGFGYLKHTSKLKYFADQDALTAWVNKQPSFNSENLFDNAVKLQNLALNQGYLLFAHINADSDGSYYTSCQTYCLDGYMYYVDPGSHDVWAVDQYIGTEPGP
jgi:hypothetical protein